MNTNFRAYFSHFRGPIIAILAVVIVFGLILGVYLVGKAGREDKNQTQTTEQSTQTTEPATEPSVEEQSPPTNQTTPSNNEAPTTPQPTQAPNTGPGELINTGPEDYSFIVFVLFLAVWLYRNTKKSLKQSLTNV